MRSFLDGRKHAVSISQPDVDGSGDPTRSRCRRPGDLPPAAEQGTRRSSAIYFNPERDQAAADRLRRRSSTRARWSRRATGAATGRWRGAIRPGTTIDDRIAFTPCHNSVMSWAGRRPDAAPIGRARHARHAGPVAADDRPALGLADRHDRRGRRAVSSTGPGASPRLPSLELSRARLALRAPTSPSAGRFASRRPRSDRSRSRSSPVRSASTRSSSSSAPAPALRSVTLDGPAARRRTGTRGTADRLWLDATIENADRARALRFSGRRHRAERPRPHPERNPAMQDHEDPSPVRRVLCLP